MNGELTKYYKYDKTSSDRVTIPIALAKALNWNHNDNLIILIKTINNKTI